jgi:hypothetical protein
MRGPVATLVAVSILVIGIPSWGALRIVGGCDIHVAGRVRRPAYSAGLDPELVRQNVRAWPTDIRPLGQFMAGKFQHVDQPRLESSGKSPIVVWGRTDRSNWWIAMLMHEYLTRSPSPALARLVVERDVVFYDHDYSDELIEFLRQEPEAHFLIIDDATYRGFQARNTVRGFTRLLRQSQVRVGVGYKTNFAASELAREFPDVRLHHGGVMPTLGELLDGRPELVAIANRVLAAGWENRVLTYFDSNLADFQSTVSLGNQMRVLEGAIPDVHGRFLRLVPVMRSPPDRPY